MGTFFPDDPAVLLHGEDLTWPLALDGTGDLSVVSGEANTLSALPVRAVTGRGEVTIFPDDGLDMDEFQNGLGTDEERAVLQARLLEQFRREDRLASLQVTMVDGADESETIVQLHGFLRTGREVDIAVPFGSG